MKKKNISEDIIFRCDAGWCEFLTLAVWDWREDGEPLEYNLAIISEPRGIFDRLKKAFQMLYKKEVYHREIIISQKNFEEMKRILNKK